METGSGVQIYKIQYGIRAWAAKEHSIEQKGGEFVPDGKTPALGYNQNIHQPHNLNLADEVENPQDGRA